MKLELQEELFRRYPKFFRKPGKRLIAGPVPIRVDLIDCDGRHESFEATPERGTKFRNDIRDDTGPFDERGVECDDGWFAIIDRLCRVCENEIERLIARGTSKECWPRVAQIKEKFGGLRFYIKGTVSDDLQIQIRHVEDEESYRTCERCGCPGKPRQGQWVLTYCDACQAQVEAGKDASAGFSWDVVALPTLVRNRAGESRNE